MLAMQTYAKTLSAGFQTAAFYGGLEPAARIPQAGIFQAMYRGPWAFEACLGDVPVSNMQSHENLSPVSLLP
jgi:hypothetical protein